MIPKKKKILFQLFSFAAIVLQFWFWRSEGAISLIWMVHLHVFFHFPFLWFISNPSQLYFFWLIISLWIIWNSKIYIFLCLASCQCKNSYCFEILLLLYSCRSAFSEHIVAFFVLISGLLVIVRLLHWFVKLIALLECCDQYEFFRYFRLFFWSSFLIVMFMKFHFFLVHITFRQLIVFSVWFILLV